MIRTQTSNNTQDKYISRRFATLDFARGMAIVLMIILHIIGDYLNIDVLLSDSVINTIPIINLLALVILPYFGGLAGFFLIVSAAANMVSMYRDLGRGKSVRSIVLKQIIGGIILLIFAMLSESTIGYHGVVGNFFRNLNNPANGNYSVFLYSWNVFETVHTIAWCLIINGCIQGLLSLKNNWKNRKQLIIAYIVLALVVIGLTQPIWTLIGRIGPGYPFAEYAPGITLATPRIGYESFWDILRAPFLTALAAPMEPLFPYLAVSFLGSIIGIIISQPKEKINKNMPRNFLLVGFVMFLSGLIGIVFILLHIMNGTYNPGTDPFDVAISFYRLISFHRHWAPDAMNVIHPGEVVNIPPFSWLAQFLTLNGFSLMLVMFLFRLVEFRGISKQFADKTRYVRRFGVVAFSNYNNQWLYPAVFFLVSLLLTRNFYEKLFWGGIFFTIVVTFLLFHAILLGWERIGYIGSLEWTIRTIGNNLIPVRKDRFDKSVKWWQRGQINVENAFRNPEWIDLKNVETIEDNDENKHEVSDDSKLALRLSIIGLCSILFIVVSFFSLFISINSRKKDGKNKHNTAAFGISIAGIILFIGIIITTLVIPIGTLGLF
ncbi:MAG: DUF1624 domain-containing protein [Asgard group archaeon]|nr:DUF1624 domain-containing protein [Asgard group archaeon]